MRLQKLGWGQGEDHEADAAAGVKQKGTRRTTGVKSSPTNEASAGPRGKQRLLFGGKGKHVKLMRHSSTYSVLPENVTTGDANIRPGRGIMVSSAIVTHAATGVTEKLKGTSSKRQRNKAV